MKKIFWTIINLMYIPIIVFIITFIILLPILPFAILADIKTCDSTYGDYQHRWGFWTGCMVKLNGKWTSTDVFRVIK